MASHWIELSEVIEQQADALTRLVEAMRARREAYIALRPSEIENAFGELDSLQHDAARLEGTRLELTQRLATSHGVTRSQPRLRDLLPHAPRLVAARLRLAGESLTEAAGAIQIESRVGERLLAYSQHVQDGLVHDLCGLPQAGTANSYDRNARQVVDARSSGRFVSGTI